jgi:hypothetical protein
MAYWKNPQVEVGNYNIHKNKLMALAYLAFTIMFTSGFFYNIKALENLAIIFGIGVIMPVQIRHYYLKRIANQREDD